MNKDAIKKALSELHGLEKKRNFSQSIDLIVNLKNFDPKSNSVDLFITLPHSIGKKPKVAAFVSQALEASAKEHCDLVITESDFEKYDVKSAKKLAQNYDYFIAVAPLMPKVAKAFGRALGTRGKMPNPKLGCVVSPNANLAPLIENLGKSVHVATRKATNLQCMVGKEDASEVHIIENILSAYNAIVKAVPNELQNIKGVQLKLTMSKPVTI
jgi:large subunit ribosomal protein L1